jgi:hypothetical protein
MIVHCAFVLQVKLKTFKNINVDLHWVGAMQEELA